MIISIHNQCKILLMNYFVVFFFFHTKSLKSCVYFTLTVRLSSDSSRVGMTSGYHTGQHNCLDLGDGYLGADICQSLSNCILKTSAFYCM